MQLLIVMAGLDPAIHELALGFWMQVVDARVKPGHDGVGLG
jgi:hypothetical protein